MTFRNISTKKSTTKKFRCVVKPVIEEPVDPTPAEATKITNAKVVTSKTFELTFDGVVNPTSATAIKVMRGSVEATVTPTFATDNKSVVLTSETAFAAGTYTITVGSLDPVTLDVARQTPTELKILNTTVANKANARVSFSVLDQYGEPMDNYIGRRLTVTAYNTTKGHPIEPNTNTSEAYFTLNCATQDVSAGGSNQTINAIDDTINVVAYLTDNAGISTTTTLKIANVYVESLEFGDVELNGDKRVTVGKTYKLPYTATSNEGEKITFTEEGVLSAESTISRIIEDSNYTLVTNNVSSVDMGDFYVDKNGDLYFTAGITPGTAVITMINNMTGTTTSKQITVNDVSKMSRLDVSDTSISWDTNKDGAKPEEIQAAVTVYDQFGDVVDPKNVRNINLETVPNSYFSDITAVPARTSTGIDVTGISSDGSHLVYTVKGDQPSIQTREDLKGQTITFTFVSATAGPNGYLTSTAKVMVTDTIEPSALKIVTDPAASVVSGGNISLKFSVYDQNQKKVKLTTSAAITIVSGSSLIKDAWGYTTNELNNNKNDKLTYAVVVDDLSGLFTEVECGSYNDNTKEYEIILKSKLAGITEADLARSGQFTVSLKEGDRNVAFNRYSLSVIRPVDAYTVLIPAGPYTANSTVPVTVEARSAGLFNSLYNDTVAVSVTDGAKTYSKTLKFEGGEATFELTAGKAADKYVVEVENKNTTSVNNNAQVINEKDTNNEFSVITGTAGKLMGNADGKLYMADAQGNPIKVNGGTTKTSYATIKVVDQDLNNDITGTVGFAVTGGGITKNSDNTVEVQINTATGVIETFDGKEYDLRYDGVDNDGFTITNIPSASRSHALLLSITVDGLTWEQRFTDVNTDGTHGVGDPTAMAAKVALDTAELYAAHDLSVVTSSGIAYVKASTHAAITTTPVAISTLSGSALSLIGNKTIATGTSCSAITGAGVGIAIGDSVTATINADNQLHITLPSGSAITRPSDGDTLAVELTIRATATVEGQTGVVEHTFNIKFTWDDGNSTWKIDNTATDITVQS